MFLQENSSAFIEGVVERIVYQNKENGYSVLAVNELEQEEIFTVVGITPQAVEGMSIRFFGTWIDHKVYGKQFKASHSIEIKPKSKEALIRFFGSGLISGIGESTSKKIVDYFGDETLTVFETQIDRLLEVPGIAKKTLEKIKASWEEHKDIRDTMLFLQEYKISPLFALKIFKYYGSQTISIVSENPYILIKDIPGVGFLSADKIALKLGLEKTSPKRISAAIIFSFESKRSEGHCYLTKQQILTETKQLINIYDENLILDCLENSCSSGLIKKVDIEEEAVYSSNKIYWSEKSIASRIQLISNYPVSIKNTQNWKALYSSSGNIPLSDEQSIAVEGILNSKFSILTGGPGCGKTTITKAIVFFLKSIGANVLLAAPTGRASQRMTEVIGLEAQTIHRLLEWNPAEHAFTRNEENPLKADFVLIDEASMLDVYLASALLKAIDNKSQVVLVGDPDQLPSVGPGNVLQDLINDKKVPTYHLTKIFRQAEASSIVKFAHKINKGEIPSIISPLAYPKAFKSGIDCLFLDSDMATVEQLKLIKRLKSKIVEKQESYKDDESFQKDLTSGKIQENLDFKIPDKFQKLQLRELINSKTPEGSLKALLPKIHPWSSLNYGKTADQVIDYFYKTQIPKMLGKTSNIQILSPQTKGTLGTKNLNKRVQELINPPHEEKKQIQFGETIFREGDRVIQTRNNYDLGVFNGDIGEIYLIHNEDNTVIINYGSEGNLNPVVYSREDITDLSLAYAITIHKSQGSEFDAVIIPLFEQHYNMLFRNLIYTGLTRAKKLAIFVGSRKALRMAISNNKTVKRQTLLPLFLKEI